MSPPDPEFVDVSALLAEARQAQREDEAVKAALEADAWPEPPPRKAHEPWAPICTVCQQRMLTGRHNHSLADIHRAEIRDRLDADREFQKKARRESEARHMALRALEVGTKPHGTTVDQVSYADPPIGCAIHVRWQDSLMLDGWRELESLRRPASVADAVGYLVAMDDEHITIAATVLDQGAAGVIVIPRRCVVSPPTVFSDVPQLKLEAQP